MVVPRLGALHHSAMPTQALLRFDPAPRARGAPASVVVALVRVELRGPKARRSTTAGVNWRNQVQQGLEDPRVVHLRGGERYGERNSVGLDHNMARRARVAFIRWIRPSRGADEFFRSIGIAVSLNANHAH